MPSESAIRRNAVHVTGDGPPLLLLHGFGCDQAMWTPIRPHLAGYRLISMDLTGHGESDYTAYDTQRHGSLAGHAEDLIEVINELDLGPVVAVGHSVSAMIVALAATKAPHLFQAIVMIGPNPHYLDDPPYHGGFDRKTIDGLLATMSENYQGWAGALATLVAGDDDEAQDTLTRRFCRNDPDISQHFATVTFYGDNRGDLAMVPSKTLVIQCEHDAIAPAQVGAYVASSMPDASLVTIPARGHAPHMTHPTETAAAIRAFWPCDHLT